MLIRIARFLRLLVLLALTFSGGHALAAVCTTQGPGNWIEAHLWNCGSGTGNGPPANGDSAVVQHAITLNTDTNTLSGLTVVAGVELSDNGNNRAITLSGPLENNGKISLTHGSDGRIVLRGSSAWSGSGTTVLDYLDLGGFALTLAPEATLSLQLNDAAPLRNVSGGAFNSGNNAKATVWLDGAAQTLDPGGKVVMPNLRLSGGFKTLLYSAGFPILGNLTIDAGATLSAATSSANVNLAGNLTIAGTLYPGDGWWTFNGSAAQAISAATFFRRVTVDNPQGVSLGGNMTIGDANWGALTLTRGQIRTGAYSVIVPRNCSEGWLTNRSAGAWINGNLQLTTPNFGVSCVFPVGDGNNYAPLTITYPWSNPPLGGRLVGSSTAGDHPDSVAGISGINASASVNRYWTLTPLAGSTYASFDVTMQYCTATGAPDCAVNDVDAAANPANFVVGEKVSSAWALYTPFPPPAPTSNSRQVSGLTDFGSFAIGERSLPGPHHFEIEHASGNGLTCAMNTLTIRACADAACTALYTGGVSGSLSASGTPTVAWDGTSGGAAGASFVIAAGVGAVTKNVQVSTPGSVVFGVSGSIPTTCTFGSPQCTFTASDAGLFVTSSQTGGAATIPAQSAGVSSAQLYLRALQASTSNPAVCTPAIAGKTVAVNLGYACNDPSTCSSGNRLTVNATAVAGSPSSNPTQHSTPVNLNFDANGSAPITLNYADVGQVTLYANTTVTPPGGAAASLRGNSNAFVVKPFSFVLSGLQCVGSVTNPGAADAQGGKFCPAGEDFSLTVTAVASGGAVTPNYGKEAPPEGVRLVPALVSDLGLTANPAVSGSFSSFSSGVASGSTFSWGEVGIITLQAGVGDSNYLGAGDVLGTASGNIGRFYPYAYTLEASALSNRPAACAPGAGGFTYIGEPDLRLDLTLSAKNKQNGVTANYRNSITPANNFAKLSTGAQFNLAAVSGGGGATKFSEGGRYTGFIGGAAADSAPTWANGTSALQIFSRLTRASSLEEYLPVFRPGIRPVDSDGVGVQAYTGSAWGSAWDIDTDAAVGNDHKSVGAPTGTELRSGRVRLQNANGSELLPLPVPLQIQYWSGAAQGWQLNAADTCTQIQAANFAFSFPADAGNKLAACETRMQVVGSAPNYTATLAAPGAGNNGWADLTLNLAAPTPTGNQCTGVGAAGGTATPVGASWLQFPWTSASAGNPTARATFGVYRSGPVIYRREMYR